MAERNRIDDQPPPGMRPDVTLIVLEPGELIPPTIIIMPDGTLMTPDELKAHEAYMAVEDDDDLRAACEAAGAEENDLSDIDDDLPDDQKDLLRPESEDPWGVGQIADGSINVVAPDKISARVAQRDADEAAFG